MNWRGREYVIYKGRHVGSFNLIYKSLFYSHRNHILPSHDIVVKCLSERH